MNIKKKIFCIVLSVGFFMLSYHPSAIAHNLDYWGGNYTNSTQIQNMKFAVHSTALDTIDFSLYSAAYDWNNISSNVAKKTFKV